MNWLNWLNKFFLPPAKTAVAEQYDLLFWYVHISSFILTLGIVIAIIYFIVKYRRKSEDDVTAVITHNSNIEVAWSVIPLILAIICFAWGYQLYAKMNTAPEEAYEIRAIGVQWNWQFVYENGITTVQELHVPAGRPVKITMNSRDVLHSFYIPAFRIKQDVVPGRYTTVWFMAPDTGRSIIYCAEYCGTSHSNMLGTVIVHEPSEFQKWLTDAKGGGGKPEDLAPAEWGEQLAQQYACMTCHSTDGSRLIGPSWQGLFGHEVQLANGSTVTADANYIRESILNPQAKTVAGFAPVMPPFKGQLNDKQISAIIEYIKTL